MLMSRRRFESFPGPISPRSGRQRAPERPVAGAFVFDGSEIAPDILGDDALLIGLRDFITDPESLDEILEFIEDFADIAYEQ